jgi:hypothetical protein
MDFVFLENIFKHCGIDMTEPTCNYCGASDKFRCATLAQAARCSSYYVPIAVENTEVGAEETSEYENLTKLDWVEYELATIFYDYRVLPEAQAAILRCIRTYING